MMEWINPKKNRPNDRVFWALTMGREENDGKDWEIRKLINCGQGECRTLDYTAAFFFYGERSEYWTMKIFGWLPLDAISTIIEDE